MLVRASNEYLEARNDYRITKKKLSFTPRMAIIMKNRNAQNDEVCASESTSFMSQQDIRKMPPPHTSTNYSGERRTNESV